MASPPLLLLLDHAGMQAGMLLLDQAGMLLLHQAGMVLLDQAGMHLLTHKHTSDGSK